MTEDTEKIAVLIPCFNEETTIGDVISSFQSSLPNAKIYVCNNNFKHKLYQYFFANILIKKFTTKSTVKYFFKINGFNR